MPDESTPLAFAVRPAGSQGEPGVQDASPALAETHEQNVADIQAALADLDKEGAPAAPSDSSAWSWDNIKKNLAEIPGQAVRGAAEAVNGLDNGAQHIAQWLNDNIVDLGHVEVGNHSEGWGPDNWITWSPGAYKGDTGGKPTLSGLVTGEAEKPKEPTQLVPDSILPAKPQTTVGQLTNDAVQLGIGLLGAGKMIKIAEGAGAATAFAGRMAQGALADFSVFDGNDEKLSDFIQAHPSVANPVTAFLATKPDDNEAVGRLKRAAEGLIAGSAVEALLYSARVARAWAKGDKKAAQDVLHELDDTSDAARSAEAAQVPPAETAAVTPEGVAAQAAKATEEEGQKQLDMFAPAQPAEVNLDGMTVYHGTAAKFDEFDISKIGSGEGTQNEGFGFYVAEHPEVARSYHRQLAGFSTARRDVDTYWLKQAGGDRTKAAQLAEDFGKDTGQDMSDVVHSLKNPEGNVYQVKMTADPASMVDLEKPFSEQSEAVQTALTKVLGASPDDRMFTGADFPKEVAAKLDAAGVHGTSYFDKDSRAVGAGTRNYVVFNKKHLKVEKDTLSDVREGAPKEPVQGELSLGDKPLPKEDIAPESAARKDQTGKPVNKVVNSDDADFQQFLKNRDWRNGLFKDDAENITGLNTQLIHNWDDAKTTLNALQETYEAEIKAARGGGEDGVVTWKETKALAARIGDLSGDKGDTILRQLSIDHQNTIQLSARMKAYGDLFATVAKKVDDLATFVADEHGPLPSGYASFNDVMADFAKHTELLANIKALWGGSKTNLARTFNAFKLGAEVNQKTLLHLNPDDLFAGGPAAMRAYARRIKAAGGNPRAIAKTTEKGLPGNLMAGAQQIWLNAILSNPATHAANVLGSLLHAAYLPTEKMVSGALRSFGSAEGRGDFVAGATEYASMMMSLKDALKLSVTAFKREAPVLDAGQAGLNTVHNAITAEAYGLRPDGTAGWLVNMFGKATNVSSRLMMAEDEFIKQMTFRANVRSNAMKEFYLRDPSSTDIRSLSETITDALERAVDPATGAAAKDAQFALEQAQKVTFSNKLKTPTNFGTKSWGEIAQGAVNDHPYLRFVLPFVRTPTNIARFTWSRTPGLNLLRKEEWNNFRGLNGAKAQADYFARAAVGGTAWAVAGSMAVNGRITGSGPLDPELRRTLEATGWKPYALKSTDTDTGKVTYTSFARMDPFATILGMAADLAQAAGHIGDEKLSEVAGHMGTALANQLKSKSYLLGLTQFLDAVSDTQTDGSKMERYIQNQVASWVPSTLKAFNKDPYMREARGVIDAVMAKIPGYSQNVDPVRNIFGEKVLVPPAWGPDTMSPFLQGIEPHQMGDQPVTKDWQNNVQLDVADEMARQAYIHGNKLTTPPKKLSMSNGSVDLTQFKGLDGVHTAYDRYQELIAQPKPGMPTLRQALQKVIVDPRYQDKLTDGEFGNDSKEGTRIMQLHRVIGMYRQAASKVLMQENPEIVTALKQDIYRASVAKRAKKTPDQQASATDTLLNGAQ